MRSSPKRHNFLRDSTKGLARKRVGDHDDLVFKTLKGRSHMEHQLFRLILDLLRRLGKGRKRPRDQFSDDEILRVWFWAVLHDRPVTWACQPCNWPSHARRRKLPSDTTLSRRLRTDRVKKLLKACETEVLQTQGHSLLWRVDGKPLVIGACSKDRQAGYGRAAGAMACGYKIHAVFSGNFAIAGWRVAPMNKDERVMARRLLREAKLQGYVLGDANYDSNALHEVCRMRDGLQLITPRRGGKSGSSRLGHRRHSPARLRCIELMEGPSGFGRSLYEERFSIERDFAHLSNWGGGLTHLPPWARTYRRVHRWVQAKLLLTALKRQHHLTT